ncbi:MAG TPA: hypothetical protein DEA50_16300 [Parvularcula sp.]|nr:hypothetical protein [Parvularcula sp.]
MSAEILAVFAALLFAAAILPGTLGVLLMTSKIAARGWGARLIYQRAPWIGAGGALILLLSWALALTTSGVSLTLLGATAFFCGVAVFGFFMHTKLMFKPVTRPLYMSVDQALEKFGPDEEIVGVIDDQGTAWGYVARLARRPHIVEQREGANPFMMTHCILAHSSMAFALEDRFAEPEITITSALANNLVFYEKKSKCSIVQAHNGSIDRDASLRMVPTIAVSLKTWKAMYPNSKVWYRNKEWRDDFYLNLLARADVIDPNSPVMVYPLKHGLDDRLPMKAMVTGVEIDGLSRTYSLAESHINPLIHDRLANSDILIASGYGGDLIQVFDRRVEDSALTFIGDGENSFVDHQTKSRWNMLGQCVSGPLKGKSLKLVPHYSKMFWYVWADYHPGAEVYQSNKAAVAA